MKSENGDSITTIESLREKQLKKVVGVKFPKSKEFKYMKDYVEKEEQTMTEEQKQSAIDLYDTEVGFSKIIEMLQNEKKSIIGHNFIFDSCFIYS